MRRILLSFAIFIACATKSWALYIPSTLYVYGISISFNDSIIHLTDIMQLDSAWIDASSGFLYARSSYAYQLKSYLQEQGIDNPTCVISFAEKRKDVEKKYVKLRKRLLKKDTEYLVKYIPITDFSFEAVSAKDEYNASIAPTKEEKKAAKKAAREARQAQRAERSKAAPGGRGPGRDGEGGPPQGPPPGGAGGGPM